MPLLHTDPSSGTSSPVPPQLPEGWRYTDDVEWDEPYAFWRRRRVWLPVLVGLLVVAVAVGFVVLNAATHYSRGVAALRDHAFGQAAAELSSAKLLVIPYRDAQSLAGEARRDLAVQTVREAKARMRVDTVTSALDDASARLDAADASGVLVALRALRAADVRAALRDSPDARDAVAALRSDLIVAAKAALGDLKWGRAGSYAAALLVLDPSSAEAASLAAEAQAGQELSMRLAKAKDAARHGEWRRALRLALAVRAAREGYPGAATVIADARRALAPKPKSTPAATASTTTTTPATSGGGTSSGSSSGSSSQPPPP